MADYKVVDSAQLDADLKVVADAIREKGGTTEQLSFPQGMKQAVEAIQSGGGSGEEFVGVKYSNFDENGLPQVVDVSSLQEPPFVNPKYNMFYRFFQVVNGNLGNGWYVKMTDVYLPNWVIVFSQEMFANCASLKNVYGDFSRVNTISPNAFQNCTSLKNIPYLPNLTEIGASFNKCTGLEKVCIYNKLNSFHASAFINCTNIKDIYVPWAEGEVANSPWGASNATIHYNTTYDENHNPIV